MKTPRAQTGSTLFVILVLSFFATGSSCDDNPNLVNGSSDRFGERFSPAPSASADPSRNDSVDRSDSENVTREESTGTQRRGQPCDEANQCAAGLACEASECVDRTDLRIALVWETELDLDLHVQTPTGEELYYRNRVGSGGGEFLRDACIQDHCDAGVERKEVAVWGDSAPAGTYEIWVVNYDGGETAPFRIEVRKADGSLETFNGSVPAQQEASSSRFAYSHEDESAGPGEMEFTAPRHEMWVRGPQVTFTVDAKDDEISRVAFTADDQYELGETDNAPNFRHSYEFTNLGERDIKASGYDAQGFERDNAEITIVVMDENDGLPNPRDGAVVSDRLLAQRIVHHGGSINLRTDHPSGMRDNAYPLNNIVDVSESRNASHSCYGTAPCGTTGLDARMLQAMVMLKQVYGYDYEVSSIAGASHSNGSRHYRGLAVDVAAINGRGVDSSHPDFRDFMQACRDMGATEVLGPGDGGHSTHIHCAW